MTTAPSTDWSLVEEAVELALRAGELTLRHFGDAELDVEHKADGSPVTRADREAEDFLRRELVERYPDDNIVGEEGERRVGTSGRSWVIDPIDGTKSFVHGVPLFTNLLALADEHGPTVGVINVPALDEIVYAGRGLGCFHNDRACQVSKRSSIEGSALTTSGLEYWPMDRLTSVVQSGAYVRTWGDGYGHVLVATGRVEAMLDPGLNPWDVAPLNVIIPEAGGTITDFAGSPFPARGDTLASNGLVHDALLDVLG